MADEVVVRNKKAFFNYEILDRYEAGVALTGTEVKAIRDHKVNLKEAFARVKNGEVWLEGCHIAPYRYGNIANHEPVRPRKLLLHRREINKLIGITVRRGFTLVPIALYFKNGKVKVEIGVARGKRIHDKREAAKRRSVDRDIQMELKRG